MIFVTAAKAEDHILPIHDAMFYRSIIGMESCVFNYLDNFEPQIITNNEIRIRPGCGIIQGRLFLVEPDTYDSITIANGTQGEKRIDLIVVRFEANNATEMQDGDWAVIQGTPTTETPVAPAYTMGDIDAGDTVAEMPAFEVELDGINIVETRKVFPDTSGSIADSKVSDATVAAYEALGFDPANYPGGAKLISKLLHFVADIFGVDYVVERGTTGIWTWKKWASGDAMCWGKKTKPAASTTSNSVYFTEPLPFSFVESPTPFASSSTSADPSSRVGFVSASTNEFRVHVFSGVNGQNVTAHMLAIGRWK